MGALPESVRRQAELSNQLSAKMKAGTLTFEDMQATPASMPVMPTGFQPQPAGAGVPGLGTPGFNPQPSESPGQQPTANAAAAPAAPPNQAAPAAEDPATEHRFKVLQGKYNAEVPRLHKEKQTLEQQLAAMQNQLQSTQALLAGLAQPPSPAQQPQHQSLVTDKEVQEYGADLIDVIRRTALETVTPKIRTLEEQFRPVAATVQQMAPVVQQTQQESQKNAKELSEEKFYNGLDTAVTNWEEINASPEFLAWLQQVDPYAGAQRGAMLAAAYQSYDLPRVVAFFTGFTKEHAAVAPTGQQQTPAPAGQPQPGTPTVSLASLAAPGTGVGGPANAGAPNEPGQRVYTRAEIAAFYADVQKGGYRGRDAERQAIEKDIFVAGKTGRIR